MHGVRGQVSGQNQFHLYTLAKVETRLYHFRMCLLHACGQVVELLLQRQQMCVVFHCGHDGVEAMVGIAEMCFH